MLHQKFCIIDSRIVANGSYNWTYYAECHNRENIVFLEDQEIITAFKKEFEQLTTLYPALDSIPNVGKSNLEKSHIKRIKESETQSACFLIFVVYLRQIVNATLWSVMFNKQ